MGGGGETDDGSWLSVTGGTLTIDADFDGLDSNGSISLTGGDLTITSADNGGDSPVDANGDITLDGA
ncbi:MAG: carbohydrate-binding domain-containing protein, partial [Brachybacterium tyrofermentans]